MWTSWRGMPRATYALRPQRTPRPSWPLSPSSRSNTNGNWRSSLVSHSLTDSLIYLHPSHTHTLYTLKMALSCERHTQTYTYTHTDIHTPFTKFSQPEKGER